MQLVESGKINLDSAITHYISSFKLNDPRASKITVRQVLHQTSGLSDHVFPEMKFGQQPATLENAIARLKTVKLASDPGQKFHYHNPNYQILALLVQVVSKENFSDYLQNHIFKPLRMQHTVNVSNTQDFYKKNEGDFSKGHIFLFNQPVKMTKLDWFVDGPAGMVSTVNDMANWLMLQLNTGNFEGTQLLSSNGIQVMHSPPPGVQSSYGIGWIANGPNNLYHSGILWTYQAEQILVTNKDYGIVVLFNSGLNAFQDYHSFVQGISGILNNQNPEVSFFSIGFYNILIGIFILITIILGIRSLFRLGKWKEKYKKRPQWQSWLRLIVRLLPLALLIAIPQIIAFMEGF
jgi:CubicO group peptidase (beta-lactamase class C family)